MRVFVHGSSALAHYRTSLAKTDIENCSRAALELRDATSSYRDIIDAGIWRLGIGEPTIDQPLEVLVRDAAQRSRSRFVHERVWHGNLAPTSFRKVGRGIFVSSPEFVFLQMAQSLDLPQLVALGMELCGTYRRNVVAFIPGSDETTCVTAYNQQPLSTPKRIKGFVTSMHSAPGCVKALKALEFVLPGSASPMETALYLLLCLPRRLGGYALPKPTLNPPITLSKAGRSHTFRNQAKPDLYWREKRLDLEYNGGEFHDESSRTVDSMRRKALERMGVEVIELTHDELFSTSLFHATALRVARRLGKRIRSEDEGDFRTTRTALRESLLLSEDTTRDDDNNESSDGDGSSYHMDPKQVPGSSDTIGSAPNESAEWMDSSPDDVWTDDLPNDERVDGSPAEVRSDDLPIDEWATDSAAFDEEWIAELIDLEDYWMLDQDEHGFQEPSVDDLHVFGRRHGED